MERTISLKDARLNDVVGELGRRGKGIDQRTAERNSALEEEIQRKK